jgi:threonine synthase
MKFYSTNHQIKNASLKEAVLSGLAPDGGLFMPETIPEFPADFFETLDLMTFQEIAFEVARPFLEADLPEFALKKIINEAFNFDTPLVPLDQNIFALELFHGPTLAFKDFGARFMARLMAFLNGDADKELALLVATSGDTGSAVAHGFLNVPGIQVFILYPSGKISHIQEQQLTTMGGNITALEVDGAFDDCQHLVKQAFLDPELTREMNLTSANSINIARLIPQSFYYFYAMSRLERTKAPAVFAVPSGNFGNLTGGLLAKRMGLPITRFVAATNANNVVPHYLASGNFEPQSTIATISNAMDVGNPSNFARILDLYQGDFEKIKSDIFGASFSDDQTRAAIKEVYQQHRYILDPHGAVGYLGLREYLANAEKSTQGVFLETAHPAKFQDVIQAALNESVEVPFRLKEYLNREKQSVRLSNHFTELKELLLRW